MSNIAKQAKKYRMVSTAAAAAVCTLTHFGLTQSSEAAVDAWTGNTSANWSVLDGFNAVPVTGDSLMFNAAGTTGASLNDDLTNSAFNLSGITFSTTASAYTISGNAFLLTGGITNSSATAQIINDAITLGATDTVTTTAAGGITLNAVIDSGANAYGLNKAGAGTLTLTNTELYSGPTTVTAGTLTLAGYQASAASSAFTVSTGGTLAINSGSGTAAASVTRGSSLAINNGAVTLTGAVANTIDAFTGALSVGAGPSSLTLTPNAAGNAQLSFGSLATHTPGSLLTMAGTFGGTPGANVANLFFTTTPSGANFVGGGGNNGTSTASIIPWMRVNNSGTLYTYNSAAGVTAMTGGVNNLLVTNPATTNATLSSNTTYTLTGNTTINALAITTTTGNCFINMAGNTLNISSGAIAAGFFCTIGNDSNVSNRGILAFGANEAVLSEVQARQLTINSVITGSGGLTFMGYRATSGNAGFLILNGANTYTGVTNVYGLGATSQLDLNNSLALQNSTLNYVNGNGAAVFLGTTGTSAPLAFTIGGLTGNNNLTLTNNNSATTGPVALTLGNDGLNDVYSGNLLTGTGTGVGGSLTFNGTGSETLLGAGNTYAGGTSVQNGTLILGHGGVLAATNTITLGSGSNSGTFQLGDSTAAVNTAVTSLQTSGSGTANAVVGGNSAVSTLTVNIASGSQTFSGTLGGGGTNQNNLGLTKTGTGVLVLSGTSTHTGPTTVSTGTLTVSGKLNGLSAVGVSGGATLNGYGTIAGMATLAGGTTTATQGNINLYDATTNTLTLGGLTVGGTTAGQVSNLDFDLGNGTLTSDAINLGPNAFVGNAGGAVINVDQLGTLAQGTYTLMTYGSDSGLTVGTNLTLNAPSHFGTTYQLNLNSGSLTLTVSGVNAPNAAYWSGVQGGSYNWGDHGTTTTNWNTDQTGSTDTGAAPGTNTDVVFANANATAASLATQLETTYSINSLTILGTGQTTVTTGAVTTIGGTGALNLIAGASGSGGLGYSAGTGIVIGAGSAGLTINTTGGVGVTANQSWTNNSSSPFSVSSNISGSTVASNPVTLTLANSGGGGTTISGVVADGSGLASPLSIVVNNTGSGITTLSGPNTYTGSTTISSGTLDVANSVALQNSTVNDAAILTLDGGVATHAFQFGALGGSGNISLTDSGSNAVALSAGSNNASTNYSGVLSGSGSLTKAGTGTMTLSNSNTYTGGTTVSGGTLRLGDGASHNGLVAGGIVDNANVSFANSSAQTFSGVISGTGTVNVTGPGTITLNTAETYTGTTTVSGGTLQLGDGVANDGLIAGNLVDNATVTFANLNALSYAGTVSGSGTLNITGAGGTTLTAANNFPGSIAIASKLTLANSAAATYSGPISGTGTVTVSSSAVVNLSGSSNYSGGTFLTSGTINILNSAALGTGSLTSSGGTLESNQTVATITLTNPIVAASGTTFVTAIGGASNLVLNGNLSGSGSIYFNSAGTSNQKIMLGGDNSGFTGTLGNYGGNAIRLEFTTPTSGSASANFAINDTSTDTTAFYIGTGTIQFGSLSGNGFIRQDVTGTTTLVIGANNSSTEFSGILGQLNNTTILNITKVGSGVQTLSGTSTNPNSNGYAGVTTVSGGTLAITGTIPVTSAYIVGDTPANSSAIFDVSGNATQPYPISATQSLSGFGTVNGNVTLSGTINPGTVGVNSSYGTLTVSGLATQTNSKLTFDLGTGAGPIITTGDVLILGSGTNSIATGTLLNFAGSTPIGGDDYRLIGDLSSGSVVDGFTLSNFTLPTPASGQTYALSTTVDPGYIDLVVANTGPANLFFTGSAGNGNWDINNTTNFTDGLTALVFHTGDNVTFDGPTPGGHNTGQFIVTVASGGIVPASMTVTGTTPYTFTGGNIGSASSTSLTVASGASMTIDRGAGSRITIELGSMSNSGTINLKDNWLLIHNTSQAIADATTASVFTQLKNGFAGGSWTGGTSPSILSSVAAGSSLYTLGEVESGTDVLVKYAYYGDADLSGHVDGTDYSLIDTGFGSGGTKTGWQNGDFNYDGHIDGSDYSLIDNAFNTQLSTAPAAQIAVNTSEIAGGSAAVPEPASLGLLGLGALGLMSRRHRRA